MLPAVRPCSSATALSRSRSSVETLMVVAAMPASIPSGIPSTTRP